MVLAALGILFVRKAVHAALLLAVVMISLAMLYAVLEAPFLFAVQIIVYTGAILMLFLFVLMLVGVDASDSVVETISGQRVLAVVAGLLLGAAAGPRRSARSRSAPPSASSEANAGGNIQAPRQHPVLPLRLRLRGHQRAADHRGASARWCSPTASGSRRSATPGRPGGPADARLRRARAAPRAAARRPASSPGTTRSTPRRCCPTAPPPSRRSRGCSRARGTVRSAPALGRRHRGACTRQPRGATTSPRDDAVTEHRPRAPAPTPAPRRGGRPAMT